MRPGSDLPEAINVLGIQPVRLYVDSVTDLCSMILPMSKVRYFKLDTCISIPNYQSPAAVIAR